MSRAIFPVRPRLWAVLVLVLAALSGAAGLVAYSMGSRQAEVVTPLGDAVNAVSHLHGLAVDPHNPSVLWAGSHQGLLRLTPERGWEIVGEVGRDTHGPLIHPEQPSVLYTTAHPSVPGLLSGEPAVSGFLVSKDRGRTWEPVALEAQVDAHLLAMSGAEPQVVYLSDLYIDQQEQPGLLSVTRDGGESWEPKDTGFTTVLSLAVHPRRVETLLIGTPEGLFASSDYGESFELLSPVLHSIQVTAVAFGPGDGQIIWAYADVPDKGLMQSEDGGETWQSVGMYLGPDDGIEYIAPHPAQPATLFLATHAVNVYRSADGGQSLAPLMQQGQPVAEQQGR